MPSIPVSTFNPYNTHVVEAPVMGSFAEVWEGRQASDIVLEDVTFKPKNNTHVNVDYMPVDPINMDDHEHTTRIRLHNPYSITEPLTEVYSCSCGMCNHVNTDDSAQQQQFTEVADEETYEMPISKFMPPAPPRIDTYDVIVACGAADPDTIIYNMMMRWYGKVAKAQAAFNPESECPPPSPTDYTFAEWCEMTSQWWIKNFEHRQKKVFVPQPHHHHHQGNQSYPSHSHNNGRQFHQRRW